MTTDTAKDQAAAQYSSIVGMLSAISVDWDRLQELRDEREELASAAEDPESEEETAEAIAALAAWDDANAEELNTLEHETNGCADESEAHEALSNDPLCVDFRTGWTSYGDTPIPEEFRILLCTGGPAVQIRGELDTEGRPYRAWLEYQDWGTPWTQYFEASSDTLCEYAAHFIEGF